jgi:hypothetical protein
MLLNDHHLSRHKADTTRSILVVRLFLDVYLPHVARHGSASLPHDVQLLGATVGLGIHLGITAANPGTAVSNSSPWSSG